MIWTNPKVNKLRQLRTETKLNSDDIGKILSCSGNAVRVKCRKLRIKKPVAVSRIKQKAFTSYILRNEFDQDDQQLAAACTIAQVREAAKAGGPPLKTGPLEW